VLWEGASQRYSTRTKGAQFTALGFVSVIESCRPQISMDRRGRALNNVLVERLWRSVIYEDIYLNNYSGVSDLELGLENYFRLYNNEQIHQSLGYKTPDEIHVGYEKYRTKSHLCFYNRGLKFGVNFSKMSGNRTL
jgi:transposase InsO family protein